MFLPTIPVLEGSTILLRPMDPEKDYKQWYEIMKNPDMHRWTGNTVPINANAIQELLQKYKDLEDIISWSVILKNSGEMIGMYWITVPKADENNHLVIASEEQRIAHEFWRKGITREARTLIYNYVIRQLTRTYPPFNRFFMFPYEGGHFFDCVYFHKHTSLKVFIYKN